MNVLESARSTVEAAANNQKVGVVVATATTSVGAASGLEIIHGLLSDISMCVGIVAGLLVIAVRLITLYRHVVSFKNNAPIPKEE